MDPEPLHVTRRQPLFGCGFLLLLLVLAPVPGRAQPSGSGFPHPDISAAMSRAVNQSSLNTKSFRAINSRRYS